MWQIYCGLIGWLLALHVVADEFSFIGVLESEHQEHFTVEIGARGSLNEYAFITGSYLWLSQYEQSYRGLNTSLNLSLGSAIKVYTGVGVFLGRYRPCNNHRNQSHDECTENYVFATYPEAGLQISLAQIRLGFYGRYYQLIDQRDSDLPMVGFYFGWAL